MLPRGDGQSMIVKKVLNNNALVALDGKKEVILLGKGIAYNTKPFDEVDQTREYQKFVPEGKSYMARFSELIEETPIQYIIVAQKIIDEAQNDLNRKFSNLLLFALAEHIEYSIERLKKGVVVKNAMLPEISKFYKTEFVTAQKAVALVDKELNVKLPEDEVGFIAIHFVNATESNEDMSFTLSFTELTGIVVNAIEEIFHQEVDIGSSRYSRLVVHIRYFARRLLDGELSSASDDYAYKQMCLKYPLSMKATMIISEKIKQEYQVELSSDEKMYFIIHIAKLYEN